MAYIHNLARLASLLAVLLGPGCAKQDPKQRSSSDLGAAAGGPVTPKPTHKPDMLTVLGYFGGEAAEAEARGAEACGGADDGSELVGTLAKEWELSDWMNSEALTLGALRGQVVVIRFWTSPGCPFCEKSMPAIQSLSEEFQKEPVTFIGAFHGKPADEYPDMIDPAKVARSWGITFPLAFDREWKTQKSWWIETGHRHATSETFVIGKDGKIVHVHPGPVFHPSDDPAEAKQQADFVALREAIRSALAL